MPLDYDIGGTPVAVFAKRETHSALDRETITASRVVPSAAAYDRRLADRELTFERRKKSIVDRETGSRWNLLGHAVDGPLIGRRLTPRDSGVYFAFAWLAFQPPASALRRAAQQMNRAGEAPQWRLIARLLNLCLELLAGLGVQRQFL